MSHLHNRSLAGWACSLLLVIVTLGAPCAFGYGYKVDEDPVITFFKAAAAHTKSSDFKALGKDIDSALEMFEAVENVFGVDLEDRFREAVKANDAVAVAAHVFHFVFLSLREKFHYNIQDNLEGYKTCRARLKRAAAFYDLILSNAVQAYDKKHSTSVHRQLVEAFKKIRAALGSPGAMGSKSRAPEPEDFRRIAREIEELLLQVFPDFRQEGNVERATA